MPAPLHFYFDFISPYGYFASLRIEALAQRHGRAVEWHGMLLGISVLKVMGLKPLMDTPLKGDYVRRDVQRYARGHGVKFGRDLDAPVGNPLPAARAFCWIKQQNPEHQAAVAHAIYDAFWGRGLDLSTPASLAAVARPEGLPTGALEAAAQKEEAAALLRKEVEASLALGVFGSPTVIVDGEPFWGVDRLAEVDEWLSRGGW